MLPQRKQGPYSFGDITATGLFLVVIVVFPQYWLLQNMTAMILFWLLVIFALVALMIAPPATAYLLAERLGPMIGLAAVVAASGAFLGWAAAMALDVSIAGSIAAASGVLFAAAFLLAPQRGLLAQMRRRKGQRLDFAVRMLLVHLLHHEDTPEVAEECREAGLHHHLGWGESWTKRVVGKAEGRALIARRDDLVLPTAHGRRLADDAVIGFGD